MPVYFLSTGSDPAKSAAIEKRIAGVIPDLVAIGSIEDVTQAVARASTTPVHVIAPVHDASSFKRLVDNAARHRDRAFFILLGEELSASDYKVLVRTGAADWVSASADPREILEIMARSRRGSGPAASAGGARPVAISFVPSAGGVGNTTLAVETAAQLKTSKATKDRRICIIDLDFQGSHVCDYLDMEPRLQIAEISAKPERLDAQLFEIFVSRHSSGLHVIAAPRTKFNFCDLNIAALDRLFDMMATRYDLMMIDLPAIWFPWTAQIIAASDAAIGTGVNTIPGLRQCAEAVAAVRDNARPAAPVRVAVNRCQRTLMGGIARRNHVERVLPGEKLFYVGEEPGALQSVNTGMPMALTGASRAMAKEIAPIAAFCAGLKSSAASAVS
jgi:pilus assembly protein CpaE